MPALLAVILSVAGGAPASVSAGQLGRIDHVADGDTVDLTNGAKIRLVQIDGLHECRHTFAALLIAAGVNPKAMSTFMGPGQSAGNG